MTLLTALTLSAATRHTYLNSTPVNVPPDIAPRIDATRFINQSMFNINLFNLPPLPYETLNTRFFTNTAAGTVLGSPGFRFDFFTNNTRRIMNAWHNEGEVSGNTWVLVWARNIVSSGPISVGPAGLLRLQGDNIDVVSTGLRAGLTPGTFFGSGFRFNQTNYFNAAGVSDLWWGVATNNTLNSMGAAVRVDNTNGLFRPFFDAPCTLSPVHEAVGPIGFTNRVSLPLFSSFFSGSCLKQFDAFAFTQQIDQTTRVVQVAFVSRSAFDTNFSTRVRFVPDALDDPFEQLGADEGHTVLVELGSVERDIITGGLNTNKIYFVDRSAFTNAGLFRNFVGNTRRPSTMEVRRDVFGFGGGFSTNLTSDIFDDPRVTSGNTPFTPSLLYNSSFQSNAVSMGYAAYSAFIDSSGVTNNAGPGTTHPTNFPGRVEIIGNNVNLDQTRIRAEATAVIKAENLVGNTIAQVDAPFASYDLGSANPPLVISNLAPAFVQRLSGRISAWSGTWDNIETNAAGGSTLVRSHVVIVDNDLNSIQPVTITDVALRSETVVISDVLNVRDQFVLEGENLHIIGGINLLSGATWSTANIKGLVNLTNDGILSFQGTALFGSEPGSRYQSFVNRGTNMAASQFVDAQYFENTGCMVANSGVISIEADEAVIASSGTAVTTNLFTNTFFNGVTFVTNIFPFVVTNISGKLQASSGIDITAGSLYASNSYIQAGAFSRGTLTLAISDNLTDGGPGSSNHWAASAGFRMPIDPANGNLLGTHLTSLARDNSQIVTHTWAGDDVGATPAGFENNLALMKLTLDGAPNTRFVFTNSTGKSSSAIYVDYLELLNNATNYNDSRVLDIRSGVKIYFANANLPPEKLDQSPFGGRLIWVRDYAGPLSGTNIVYPSPPYPPGTVVRANIALATSKDIDSDADGIVNVDDPDPFFISSSVGLTISANTEGDAYLSWNALGKATNILECTANVGGTSWTTVTNFVQGDYTTRVTIRDSLSNDGQRVYRVRVLPAQ